MQILIRLLITECKRIIRKPLLLVLFIMMPLVSYVISQQMIGHEALTTIGVCMPKQEIYKEIAQNLSSKETVFRIEKYENSNMLERAVLKGSVDCGFVFPEDLEARLSADMWQSMIVCYESSHSKLAELVKEQISAVIFEVYSNGQFEQYEKQQGIKSMNDQYAKDAMNYYSIQRQNKRELYVTHTIEKESDSREQNEDLAQVLFPVRGILAIFLQLISMCSVSGILEDERRKLCETLPGKWRIYLMKQMVPLLFGSVMFIGSLIITQRFESISREILGMLVLWGMLLIWNGLIYWSGHLIGQGFVTNLIIIVTILSVVIAPIWIDIGQLHPLGRVLQRMIPITYYINLF